MISQLIRVPFLYIVYPLIALVWGYLAVYRLCRRDGYWLVGGRRCFVYLKFSKFSTRSSSLAFGRLTLCLEGWIALVQGYRWMVERDSWPWNWCVGELVQVRVLGCCGRASPGGLGLAVLRLVYLE